MEGRVESNHLRHRWKDLLASPDSEQVGRIVERGEVAAEIYLADDILIHDAHTDNIGIHMALADMKGPDYPVALGVIRDVKDITYDDGVRDQMKAVASKSSIQCVDDLLNSGSTWEVL